MNKQLSNLINDINDCEEGYEISRWQLRAHAYLEHAYNGEIANAFQEFASTGNMWDDSAKQRGYLESLLMTNNSHNVETAIMEHKREIIKELLSVIEILQQFYEPPEQIAPQFLSWISHVSDVLEAAEMDKELKIWQKAIERVSFVADESSLPVQMSSLRTIILGMQKKLDNSNDKDVVIIAEPFIANERVSELSKIISQNYDLSKLVELCKELNYAYAGGCYLSVAMLIRAILDHVPPIFEKRSFSEIANNYGSLGYRGIPPISGEI